LSVKIAALRRGTGRKQASNQPRKQFIARHGTAHHVRHVIDGSEWMDPGRQAGRQALERCTDGQAGRQAGMSITS